jgi:mono/diheme cytochrome c family protein
MVRFFTIASLFAAAPAFAGQQATLKPGPDVNLVTATCSVCHTPNYIRMNSVFLTSDAWKAEVTKMRKIYGAQFDEATAAIIVNYLSETYATPPKP